MLRTICDLTQERLKVAKEVFGTCELRYTQDSVNLQNYPDITLVIIATLPNSHTPLALQMLENGKHVFEKPLALNSMDVYALLEQNPEPNADEIRQAMDAVYCRCGTYHRIRKAVARAAELALQSGSQAT